MPRSDQLAGRRHRQAPPAVPATQPATAAPQAQPATAAPQAQPATAAPQPIRPAGTSSAAQEQTSAKFEEPNIATRRFLDQHRHFFTITNTALSLMAILVSLLTLWDNHTTHIQDKTDAITHSASGVSAQIVTVDNAITNMPVSFHPAVNGQTFNYVLFVDNAGDGAITRLLVSVPGSGAPFIDLGRLDKCARTVLLVSGRPTITSKTSLTQVYFQTPDGLRWSHEEGALPQMLTEDLETIAIRDHPTTPELPKLNVNRDEEVTRYWRAC